MKKILVIALSVLMMTTVGGCSPKKQAEEDVSVDKVEYFGKVKSILGNEIELEIANGDAIGIGDEEEEEDNSEESTPAAGLTEAMTGENKEFVSGDANKKKMELEYTGEIENITIPGGVTVIDLITGKDGKISDIKDGSVVIVYTEPTAGTISKIEILE